ncbi:MAG: hypothetical protein BRD47_06245 [Bacteroidetes bacterium QS_8_68_28]|nr:MAG: hypothetical protein BRD47_06245 [Bacteroidetes bacterium QS_8_68_28]
MSDAGQIVAQTHRVDSEAVLRRADRSGRSPYDCEYVRLAATSRRTSSTSSPRAGQHVTGVNAREQKLRRACADLANELAYTLQADGQSTSVRRVHAAAEKKIEGAERPQRR